MGKKFLVIKHKNIPPRTVDIEYDANWVNKTTQALNEVIKANNIKTTSTKNFKSILKTVSNIAPTYKIGNVSRALEEVLTNGRVSNKLIESDLLKYANVPLRGIATQMGYGSFDELYNRIKFSGTGFGKAEIESFINASKTAGDDHYTRLVINHNKKRKRQRVVDGIEINLIETIDESYDSEVPLKRVENNFDITNAIYNKTGEISFDGFITNANDKTVEDIKDELLAIRASKISFDIEFKEYTIGDFIYDKPPITDCFFTSISFEKSSSRINGYNISFSVVPVKKGFVQITKDKLVGSIKTKTTSTKTISNKIQKSTTKPTGNTNNPKIEQKQDKAKKQPKKGNNKGFWNSVLDAPRAFVQGFNNPNININYPFEPNPE